LSPDIERSQKYDGPGMGHEITHCYGSWAGLPDGWGRRQLYEIAVENVIQG
jgi:hypothetical protein